MAIETFSVDRPTGETVGFRFLDSNGLAFDFNDDVFRTVALATTPELAATEGNDIGEALFRYTASLDLARLHNSSDPKTITVAAISGGTTVVSPQPLRIINGALSDPAASDDAIILDCETVFRTTGGAALDVVVAATQNGANVDLTGSTCTIEYREAGASTVVLTVDENDPITPATPVVLGRFALTHALPVAPADEFEGDRIYVADVTVVLPSTQLVTGRFPIQVWG